MDINFGATVSVFKQDQLKSVTYSLKESIHGTPQTLTQLQADRALRLGRTPGRPALRFGGGAGRSRSGAGEEARTVTVRRYWALRATAVHEKQRQEWDQLKQTSVNKTISKKYKWFVALLRCFWFFLLLAKSPKAVNVLIEGGWDVSCSTGARLKPPVVRSYPPKQGPPLTASQRPVHVVWWPRRGGEKGSKVWLTPNPEFAGASDVGRWT